MAAGRPRGEVCPPPLAEQELFAFNTHLRPDLPSRDDGGRAGGDASGPVCRPASRPVRAHCRPPAGRSAAVPARMRVGLIAACMPGLARAAGVPDARAESSATDLDAVLVVAQRASRVSNGALNLDLEIRDT